MKTANSLATRQAYLFKDGKLVDQVIGAVPRAQLEQKFEKYAAAPAARPVRLTRVTSARRTWPC